MADDTSAVRARPGSMASTPLRPMNGSPRRASSSSTTSSSPTRATAMRRNPPLLPTPTEALALLAYPLTLAFGTLFSALSPETRAAAYDPSRQSHVPAEAPSYFARKDNLVNVLFVKRGWAWVTAAFLAFALTHPALKAAASPSRRARAALRWSLVTAWWFLVTQWCFGAPIIDRGFRFTGGRCDVASEAVVAEGSAAGEIDLLTAVACKAAGGRWSGGHDISGHVFLLVLGSFFLLQEVGWVALRAAGRDDRAVVMPDGAVKGAGVEADRENSERVGKIGLGLGPGGRFAVAVIALCGWMLLMTAIYFHTWFEKVTGLITALLAIYPIYILPRWVPAVRGILGLPGI